MGWLDRISPTDAEAAGDASDATNINGAPHNGRGSPSVAGTPAASDGPDPPLSEEIKRRQVALLVRYVMTIRAR
jgi:hypothetical protein